MVKDSEGNHLHIDDAVTFNQNVRPKRLIGRHGRIASLGEKAVTVDPIAVSGRSITKKERIDPQMLTKGLHRIVNPILLDPQFQRLFLDGMKHYFGEFTDEAIQRGIISDKQARELVKLMREMNEGELLLEADIKERY